MTPQKKLKNPYPHNGTSQVERLIQALTPEQFKIDDRSMMDLLAFARNYAGIVDYYNEENQRDDYWTCFWEIEPLVQLAILGVIDTDAIALDYKELEQKYHRAIQTDLDDDQDLADQAPIIRAQLINRIFSMAVKINHMYQNLPDLPALQVFKGQIRDLVLRNFKGDQEELQKALRKLIAFDKYERGDHWDDYEVFSTSDLWALDLDGYFCITPPIDFNFEALHNLFLQFHKALAKLKKLAIQWFDQLIQDTTQSHEPHIALFITFLRLFQHAQDALNGLTRKHLDYYYEEVLCLHRRAEEPDQVHLVFELAKGFHEHLLAKGTLLDGSKGLQYQTLEEWVINAAKIAQISTTFLNSANEIFALPAADTADGISQAFADPATAHWRLFGDYDATIPKESVKAKKEGEIGFAIASPMLLLKEGKRVVRLELSLTPLVANQNEALPEFKLEHFEFRWSTESAWHAHELKTDSKLEATLEKLTFILTLSEDAPAIVPMTKPQGENFPISLLPTLKILIKKGQLYHWFKKRRLTQASISLDVKGVQDLVLQNPYGIVAPKQAFQPFGPNPKNGEKLFIGSTEVFEKPLTGIDIHFDWIGAPDDFNAHYRSYFHGRDKFFADDASFQLKISQLFQGSFKEIPVDSNFPLFDLSGNAAKIKNKLSLNPFGDRTILLDSFTFLQPFKILQLTLPTFSLGNKRLGLTLGAKPSRISSKMKAAFLVQKKPGIADLPLDFESPNPRPVLTPASKNGFLTIELVANGKIRIFDGKNGKIKNRDFLHDAYPAIFADVSLKKANEPNPTLEEPTPDPGTIIVINPPPPPPPRRFPNPPYTPTVNGISIDYRAQHAIKFNGKQPFDQFFYLTPFEGFKEVDLTEAEHPAGIIPVYYFGEPDFGVGNQETFTQATEPASTQGNLYLGLEDLSPGKNLAIFFQLREGSERDFEADLPKVRWSYLADDNEWKPFPPNLILEDETLGLSRSGIIQLAIPRDLAQQNTLFDPELSWLRASVTPTAGQSIGAFPDVIAIKAQAVRAAYLTQQQASAHLAEPLPAKTIKKLAAADFRVKKVDQPFASFNGRLSEQGQEFYIRVSERLRHRNRAVAIWDYERLLLQAYPELYRVKCLNHTQWLSGGTLREIAPGYVTVAVVPSLRNQNIVNRATPRVSVGKRRAMEEWLRKKTNLFVAAMDPDNAWYLRVVNPRYEPIRVKCTVEFMPKLDKVYYTLKLDLDLKRFLAPWMFDEQADISFERKLHCSQILYFIESRAYVHAVKDFEVLVNSGGDGTSPRSLINVEIKPAYTHGILTTFVHKTKKENEPDHDITAVDVNELCTPQISRS